MVCRARALELWGGVECTVNRVSDRYFDQLERSGHAQRVGDLDLFASLGIRALRYPVLWERHTASRGDDRWAWADERLLRLRELGIRPIAGLVHHGSGPPHTSLLDPAFPQALARYARALAERHPWIEDWSPINEPVTTARFSALYGHWYPHARDVASFVRALLGQCLAIARAMLEIRAVQPRARLVLPEDFGRIRASERLGYQAEYENQRRLLAVDLLTGRVGPEHSLWEHLLAAGARHEELDELRDRPCPPDVLGVNYYLTSDRFLDEDLARHAPVTHGGNGRDRYADVGAVRTRDGITGHGALLRELWQRYAIPLAITEVHAGCTREEQLRWMAEAWSAATNARAEGVDVRAVTAWSLLGTFDWNRLVVEMRGHYEPGVFDVRSSPPRATALVRQLRGLAHAGTWQHAVLETPG
jgi:dTDP-4-dehydrorhamnose reductase